MLEQKSEVQGPHQYCTKKKKTDKEREIDKAAFTFAKGDISGGQAHRRSFYPNARVLCLFPTGWSSVSLAIGSFKIWCKFVSLYVNCHLLQIETSLMRMEGHTNPWV